MSHHLMTTTDNGPDDEDIDHEVQTPQSDPLAIATQSIADHFSDYKKQSDHQHRVSVILQCATIGFIVLTAGIALWQGFISRWQLSEMHDAGLDTRRLAQAAAQSAESTERLSPNNRAWIFVKFGKYETKPSTPNIVVQNTPRSVYWFVHFTLHNFGNSPAIISSIEPHLFVIPPEARVVVEPDPRSPTALDVRETNIGFVLNENSNQRLPYVSANTPVPSAFSFGENQVVLPTNDGLHILSSFFFVKTPAHEKLSHDADVGFHWFFCVVQYRDIYGVNRETGYYAKLGLNNTTMAPTEPNRKYNYWH